MKSLSPYSYNEILGTAADLGVPSVRAQISKGDKISISGLSAVTFTPVTTPLVTSHTTITLGAGTWVVNQDIGPGRYVATPGPGQSGNFIVKGKSFTAARQRDLGSDTSLSEVPSVNCQSLQRGSDRHFKHEPSRHDGQVVTATQRSSRGRQQHRDGNHRSVGEGAILPLLIASLNATVPCRGTSAEGPLGAGGRHPR